MATVTVNLAALESLTDETARRGIRAAGLKGEEILKSKILNRPGTGKKHGKHRASAPGEPPAADTGNLRANTNAEIQARRDGDTWIGEIVSNAEYALVLERGSSNTARSLTADALRGLNTSFNQKNSVYGPARLPDLASEVGTERMAARPFLSLLLSEHAEELRAAFVQGAKR